MALAKALETNQTLLELGLRENQIGPDAMIAFVQALLTNKTLQSFFCNAPPEIDLAIETSLARNARIQNTIRNMKRWRSLAWSISALFMLQRDIYKPGHGGFRRAAASFESQAASMQASSATSAS
ncbi:unnamed protein product [Durusdinium trenchii]|uniref:Uncharacterized protein n=1 Tax=Durusdinium trenchii TaxID=1381693 RepID=A0ABP0RSE0_9DINO